MLQKNLAKAWSEGRESLVLDMASPLNDDGFRQASSCPYTDEALITAWNQGRESVTLELSSPAKTDGLRPAFPNPYGEK